jgi:hypothetical protein
MTVHTTKRSLTVVAFAAALGLALPAMAAGDWIKYGGIDGETKIVALEKVEWRAMPTTGCSGRLTAGSMIIRGELPPSAAGQHTETLELHVRLPPLRAASKAGLTGPESGDQEMTVELEDVLITSATRTTAQNSSAVVSLGKLDRVEYGGGSWSVKGCRS